MTKKTYRILIPRRIIIPKRGSQSDLYPRFIEYGILGLIIFSPLPAASVFPWSTTLIALVAVVLTICYYLYRNKPILNPGFSRPLRKPAILFTGFFIFLLFQIVPLPKIIVKLISPNSIHLREQFSYKIGEIDFCSISLAPFQTFREGLELLSYFLIGFLIIKTVTTRKQIRRIYILLIGMGFFEAFYGIFQLYRDKPQILFYEKIFNLDKVTGTFINQNHLAGYLEMIIPLALGLIIANIDLVSFAGKSIRDKFIHITEKGFVANLILLIAVFVMMIGVSLSRSRSGFFLVILTFFLFAALSAYYFGSLRHAKSTIKRFLQITFICITIFFIYFGLGSTIDRFSEENVVQDGRLQYWDNTIKIIGDFPLFGSGIGTFAFIYPAYEQEWIHAILIHTHNDYLEYFSELGIFGFLMLAGGLFFLIKRTFFVWKRRRNPELKGLALGGMVSLIVIAVHSITDFNLHIPANMLLFTVILSLNYVIVHYRRP